MSKTNLVRPSRDGDQFHYLWASRQCLQLLAPGAELVAISIEGPSPSDARSYLEQLSGYGCDVVGSVRTILKMAALREQEE